MMMEIVQPGGKAAPDDRFRNAVAALLDPLGNATDGRFYVGQRQEVQADVVAERPPLVDVPTI